MPPLDQMGRTAVSGLGNDRHDTRVEYHRATGSYGWVCSCGEGSRAELPHTVAESLAEGHRAWSSRRHLWEYDHPYYCGEATWYCGADGTFDHHRWSSWREFRHGTVFVDGDRDQNLLIRWDWLSWRRHPDPSRRSDQPDELCLYFVIQRKPILCSHYIEVTDEDEPEVRMWLEECARTIGQIWEPIRVPAPERQAT
jgi:hypothetical protein